MSVYTPSIYILLLLLCLFVGNPYVLFFFSPINAYIYLVFPSSVINICISRPYTYEHIAAILESRTRSKFPFVFVLPPIFPEHVDHGQLPCNPHTCHRPKHVSPILVYLIISIIYMRMHVSIYIYIYIHKEVGL